MSDENNKEHESTAAGEAASDSAAQQEPGSTQSGPQFTESPDPLAGVKKSAGVVLDSMEGKTVSMKTYVGTIIGVIVLMLLARCGG